MITFWASAGVMMLLALVFAFLPLTRATAAIAQGEEDSALNVYRHRLQELRQARAAGQLSEEEWIGAREELARLLQLDTSPDTPVPARRVAHGAVAWGLAAVFPLAAVALYLWLGDVGVLWRETAPAPPARVLRVQVTLAPGLAPDLDPSTAVFVFARAARAGGAPLAILRRSARELPFEVELSDAHAMVPGNALSHHRDIVVGARLSRSGGASARAGDVEGYAEVAGDAGIRPIKVELSHVVP